MTIMSTEDEKDCYLSLAYRELNELPRECIARLEHVQHLDLSNNKFSYPPKAHCYLSGGGSGMLYPLFYCAFNTV